MMQQVWTWLTASINWHGGDSIPTRLLQHIEYCMITLAIAVIIAIPLGSWIAHCGQGRWIISAVNALRAVPSLWLLLIVTLWLQSKLANVLVYTVSSVIVLVILAVPPLLAGAYVGVSEVDPVTSDAARGMGMTSAQVFSKIEFPCAIPLIFSALRSAILQTVATTTIAAYVSIGGLGRYLVDGLAQNNYPKMAAGAILVATLALVADLLLGSVQGAVVSPGLSGRSARRCRGNESQKDADHLDDPSELAI